MAVPWPEIAAHRERLVRIARRRVPTFEDAEDVASEAMLRAATYDDLDPERLPQFLTAVTIRLSADVYRTAERGTRLVHRLHVDDERSPEDLACEASDAAAVRELVGALPTSQRQVLIDRAYGLSVTQISQRHALSYKAVESALSRARATMRAALATAMALAAAAAASLRRRPEIELALPAATVVLVTAVVAPFVSHPTIGGDPLAAPPPAVAAQRAVPRPGPAAPVLAEQAAVRAPAPPAPDREPKPKPSPTPTPTPTGTPIVIDPPGGGDGISDEDGKPLTEEDLVACLEEGPWVEATVDPRAPSLVSGSNGCGRP